MSALASYLAEVRRRLDLIENADGRDSTAISVLEGHCRDHRNGVMTCSITRQDRNRLLCRRRDFEEAAFLRAIPPDQRLLALADFRPTTVVPDSGRSQSRLEIVLRCLASSPLQELQRRAMDEAGTTGKASVVAPLLERAAKHYEQEVAMRGGELDYSEDARWYLEKALSKLDMYVPAAPPPPKIPAAAPKGRKKKGISPATAERYREWLRKYEEGGYQSPTVFAESHGIVLDRSTVSKGLEWARKERESKSGHK